MGRIVEFVEKKRAMLIKKDKPDPFHFLKKTRSTTTYNSHFDMSMSSKVILVVLSLVDDDVKRRETKNLSSQILRDPMSIDVQKIRIQNQQAIKTYIQNILKGLRTSLPKMPAGIRILFKYIYHQLREKVIEVGFLILSSLIPRKTM